MTMAFAFEIGLAALLLALAGWTIAVGEAFRAVIAFVVYGLLLAIVWVVLFAVDVALAEAAIGSGLTGALLLGAAARLRASEATAAQPGLVLRVAAALLSGTVAAGLAAGVLLLPDPAPTLAQAAADNATATSLGNPVTNVLIAFRAMDTMLEKFVLLLALVGVWSLSLDQRWGGRPGARRQSHREGVLAFFAQMVAPVGIIVGVYILWVSADHPGGAFQGGTLLAAMWLLVMTAGLADAPPIGRQSLRLLLIAGPAFFLIVGFGGWLLGGAFLAYPVAYAKPLILAIEFAMTMTIAATLGLLMLGPPERSIEQ